MIPKTILVVDGGLFQPLAHRLAQDFNQVLYFREWRNGMALMPQDIKVGDGYEDIERVDSIMGCIREVDLFIFPDLYFPEEQEYLRSLGKMVFGAGRGEEMELYRQDFWEKMQELKMPTIPHETVMGIADLREYLKTAEDKYVKVSKVRGLMETWKHENYELSKPQIDDIERRLTALSEDQEFIIEDAMQAKREVGSDQIVVDGNFGTMVQYAVEGKDRTALAMMRAYEDLPKEVRYVNEKLEPLLREYQYRGYFSTEIRVGANDNKPYLIDPTCRHASPCGETYNMMVENLGEMILAAAQGEMEKPKVTRRYAAQALICADLAEDACVPIYIDPKVRDNVCLYNSHMRPDGQEVVIHTDAKMLEVGSCVGLGSTIDSAIKECQRVAEGVKGYKISCYTDKLEEFKKDLLV